MDCNLNSLRLPVLFDDGYGVYECAVVDLIPHASGSAEALLQRLQLSHADGVVEAEHRETAQELARVHGAAVVPVDRLKVEQVTS